MKKRDLAVGVTAIALVITTIAIVNVADAQNILNDERFEQKKAMVTALENNDYYEWKEVAGTRCQQNIENMTEERFGIMAEIHQLIKDKEFETAKELAEKNDLKMPFMKRKYGQFRDNEKFQAIKDAIEVEDYNGWKESVGDKPIVEKITEENFNRYVEMHNLKQVGDIEGAKSIATELGLLEIKHKMGQGRIKHGFFGQGSQANPVWQ